MPDEIQMRVHGSADLPTLVYLPGLHGNWRLIGRFREALGGRVRFVETTYPPTLTWSLENYAEAVEASLARLDITRGWLLAESFSSQVAWPMVDRNKFSANGLILAGGFVQHPFRWGVRLAERVCGDISFGLLLRILFGYAKVSRWRFRKSPETHRAIMDFIEHLTEEERLAAKHRLHLVAGNNACDLARKVKLPVYALTGILDPVVPWYWARRWLKKNCRALREYKIIWTADHNVLGTGSQAAAELVVRWMSGARSLSLNVDL